MSDSPRCGFKHGDPLPEEEPEQVTRVRGNCPMGCGETLFVGEGGCITCSWHKCPKPDAVDTILAEGESEHIVTFGLDTFTVRHPLRERVDDHGFSMENCGLHGYLAALNGPPVRLGRYRARFDGEWRWEQL